MGQPIAGPGGEPIPLSLKGGRYDVRGLLGTGSQALTLEAFDREGAATVAVKRFSVRGASSWKEVELAEREARVLSKLRHPNLPRYLDHFEEDGALYLVMEKIDGVTLAELQRSGRPLTQAAVKRFLGDTASVLEYLHGQAPPVIHRDIKPHNVIQRPDGSFALVDFGSVRERLRPEGGSTVVGTFGYMAPEQFQGRAFPATDLYGAGATALFCLTGEEPENLPHRGLALDVRSALKGQVPESMIRLLAAMLEPDPEERPESLKRALLEHGAEPRRKAARSRRERRRQERAERRARLREITRRPPPDLGPLLLALVLLALFAARLATFALFRVFLPILLGFLGIFFGSGLRRAARHCYQIGRAGEEGMTQAMARLRGRQEEPRRLGVRVVDTTGVRVEADEPAEDEEDEDEDDEEPRRERR